MTREEKEEIRRINLMRSEIPSGNTGRMRDDEMLKVMSLLDSGEALSISEAYRILGGRPVRMEEAKPVLGFDERVAEAIRQMELERLIKHKYYCWAIIWALKNEYGREYDKDTFPAYLDSIGVKIGKQPTESTLEKYEANLRLKQSDDGWHVLHFENDKEVKGMTMLYRRFVELLRVK